MMTEIINNSNGTAFCIVPASIEKHIINMQEMIEQLFAMLSNTQPKTDGLLNLQEAKQLIGIKSDNKMKKLISEGKIHTIKNGKLYQFDKQRLLNEYCNIK